VEEEEHRLEDRIARARRICEGRERDEREGHWILCELAASRNQGASNIPKIHIQKSLVLKIIFKCISKTISHLSSISF
jgi:hypothetical protein